ncbi:hypothetical protein BN129_2779 [Cronobacter sakazakii 701]|nr:hypothetical protein BN129_2779 [Cronobacter sakazakii 701]
MIDIRLFHQRQKLPRVGGKRLDITALPFGVERVESQRRFAGTRQPGHDDQFVARNDEIDIFEIVGAGAPNFYLIHSPFLDLNANAWVFEGQPVARNG